MLERFIIADGIDIRSIFIMRGWTVFAILIFAVLPIYFLFRPSVYPVNWRPLSNITKLKRRPYSICCFSEPSVARFRFSTPGNRSNNASTR